MPKNLEKILDVFDNQAVGEAIRNALRSAGATGAKALRALTKTELSNSEQSTGATERAVTHKAGRSKSNPNKFYAIVGIDKSVVESHKYPTPDENKTKTKKGKQRGIGLFAIRQRQGRRKQIAGLRDRKGMTVVGVKVRSKQVFSRWKNSPFKNMLAKRGFIKRKPSRYFHLINEGAYNWLSGQPTKAYQFIQRTITTAQSAMQSVFTSRLSQTLPLAMARQINRNVERANKALRNN